MFPPSHITSPNFLLGLSQIKIKSPISDFGCLKKKLELRIGLLVGTLRTLAFKIGAYDHTTSIYASEIKNEIHFISLIKLFGNRIR